MAENSVLTSTTGRTSLADSSIFDSKVTEISKENLLIGSTSYVEEEMPQIETRVILVQEAGKQEELIKALKTIKIMEVPVIKIKESCPGKSDEKLIKSVINMDIKVGFVKMESVEEFEGLDSPEFENVFVVTDFQDSVFNDLYKADCRVIGPPVVLNCSQKGEPLPFSCRPLYCTSMMNLVLCFTGFRKKEELVRLVTLVHHMGGVIRKDFNSKVTHLVANCTQGEKFRVAVSLGTPIMKPEWIYKAWERRNEQDFYAAVDDFRNEFKVPPFQDCILSFLGFSDEEKTNMEEMTEMQGGKYLPLGDERCTHLVVEENIVKDLPFEPSKKLYVVKQEWFWGSIQMDARAGETMYLYEKANTPELKKSVSMLSLNTPNSNRKRRRLKETLAQLSRETDVSPFPPHTPKSCTKSSKSSTPVPSKQSARWQVAKELYQTESNYVNILATIIQLFQVPLEEEGQRGGPILAPEEIKTIFGSIPDIFDVHTKIKDDLEDLIVNWDESKSIGDIFLKYSKDLVKTYPPFVNFFEMSKETIIKCEKQKPRFHAFLKINQAKPECGRQSLVELLIRPVQRLPSVALLLNDLKKHTADENPDKSTLEKAIGSLKEVMTHINEDKRKTEAQKQIFDVVYEVDGCPANLLSSHRSLVQRVETISLGEHPCDRGEQVTLFLFNDCLEIARKRHKVIGTFRSPHGQTRPPASLKHIHLMPLSQIKKVLDIRETEDCHNAFALLVRPPTEQANVLLSFQMTSDELPKENWLKMLCRHVANTICKADAENLIYTADPESFEVNTKDMDSTLSRASRAIKKTSKKVTRAFSFSKTPKRALRRALMTSHGSVEGRSPSSNDKHVMSRLSSTSSLAGIPSPSLVSLPSFFERRSHTLSRSTTHLI
ncbi:protein ECT2 isoform X7 [Homo sapiens]|uniref:protein ECT2 isoform X7 n=1 Tax=Homo sapiens TaxID=9606 RepID=UPI001FB04B55|nr:protein ECT2 isoform X7 [Homo sapiens]XP_047303580.1 protein ECT2 isoform X7 [Homo sapiens]XP_047303581.1 protein ECT2 isoform X7 [Homo sapiens]XP_047303582.1 protein ECT2 isoform X7 [Homo sapiens]XP_054201524.1 protein ECT2 isoform X7 [Homo sapiens]XP_054201525.1 protein ECT2 isoform X7 [Homo sapiens]XP_054201526.1 protein ECT2 isoform X7 [Homo sapiens]XP_054201527.1 protein ECT2 isoform X7 [Homo sapiens]